jgi:transcriptional regulator with XRE-family HTH domain
MVTGMANDRVELGVFLRARRDRLTPVQAGIEPFPGQRRVPGLRRDELAFLAGLSPEYYSRIEQGRQANISAEVLDALARALRLDHIEAAHLNDLATPASRPVTTSTQPSQRPDPGLMRVMATLDHVPVLLLGHRGDVLARNQLLRAVLGDWLEPGDSFPRYLFLEPEARRRIINWAQFAQASVGALRRERSRQPHDRRLLTLIDDLRVSDADFACWWDDFGVRDYTSVAKRIQHPLAGELSFDIEIISAPHQADQRLIVYTAEPDSPTMKVLPLLASWEGTSSPASTPPSDTA